MQSFSSSAGIPGSMQPCCAPLALKPLYFFLDPFRSFRIDCIFVELYLQSNLEMNHWNSDIFKVCCSEPTLTCRCSSTSHPAWRLGVHKNLETISP
ncbi:hypothetical protein Y1Q_0006195 [Alligator mississippiensis]|uniref:Uncharacterized protein n=1 Tax=Alligator mississippiensis TaxID=8496 RepID=A0A151NX62_ALLMI|nr:hypothetical protein Y1Q_0006195 [Alligator mississippiensis]